jgi:MFS family permease
MMGGLLAVTAAYLLLNTPPSGRRIQSRAEEAAFCLTFAVGLAAIGFALSPVTAWLTPALIFLIGGLFLIAWTPQAFARRRMPQD